jgi:xanthine dehydrogenase accessory factor
MTAAYHEGTMIAPVLREAWERLSLGERLALATLVATRGSTPQKVGARLLVRADGATLGTLGGGAVEAEAAREAALRIGWGQTAVHEYTLSTGTDEWGLACGGTMLVFIEPLDERALGWLSAALEAQSGGDPVAVVTSLEGARAGVRLLVRGSEATGSLGDPALDGEAADLGRRVLAEERPALGSVAETRVYAEVFAPAPSLVIVGAGHVGKALATLGKFLGLEVTVIDDRPEYATPERFPEADRVIAAPVTAAVAELRVSPRSAIVVAMRNHDLDYEATAAALRTPARHVGLIGSRRKAILVAQRLLGAGIAAERVRALRSPIGLDIGAATPPEIALAILAEWIMLRQGGAGKPLQLGPDLMAKASERAEAARAPRGVEAEDR